jgi:hypothetical protein
MSVKLLFTLICDDVRVEDSTNKLIIIGLYGYSINIGIAQPQSPPPGAGTLKVALPYLCFVRRWQVDSPGRRAKTTIIDPGGASHQIGDTELIVRGDDYHQEIIKVAGMLLEDGTYKLVTTWDDDGPAVHEEKFRVKVTQKPA